MVSGKRKGHSAGVSSGPARGQVRHRPSGFGLVDLFAQSPWWLCASVGAIVLLGFWCVFLLEPIPPASSTSSKRESPRLSESTRRRDPVVYGDAAVSSSTGAPQSGVVVTARLARGQVESTVLAALRLGENSAYVALKTSREVSIFRQWSVRAKTLRSKLKLRLTAVGKTAGGGESFKIALDGENDVGWIVLEPDNLRWAVVEVRKMKSDQQDGGGGGKYDRLLTDISDVLGDTE